MAKSQKYSIVITSHAERSLKKLKKEKSLVRRLDKKIRSLAQDPRPPGCKKLKSDRYDNMYRIREGDWRILYAVEDDQVVILIMDIARSDQAYR
jgi:mRNA interferase RelE/StbE